MYGYPGLFYLSSLIEDHIFEKLEAVTDEEKSMGNMTAQVPDAMKLEAVTDEEKSMGNMTAQVPDAMADARQSIDMGKNS
ncbi:Adrenodoxin, mitochondrial [Manis javanica]|nr:Adrenodoxin, mitochondrial [Manis javanica]